MSALDTFAAAWADRDAAAKAIGLPVVGYLGNCAPIELIRAAGCFAQQVTGSPEDATPDALEWLEPVFDGWALSVFQQLLDGRLGHLAALVFPRGSEVMLQLYYNVLEVRRQTGARLPEPILSDILATPFAATARYNAGRLAALRERLGRFGRAVTDAALAEAIGEADETRRLLARLNALRTGAPPRLSGAEMLTAVGAATVMAPRDFAEAATALLAGADRLPERHGPRLLVTGSGHDSPDFHIAIEAQGSTVTADDHGFGDWWFAAQVGDGAPMESLARHYRQAPSLRSFPRTVIDARLMDAVQRGKPDLVVFFTDEWDDTLGFDYPTQRALLSARGIPSVFLKQQSYRHPERAAQAAAVAAALAEAVPA